MFSLLDIKKTTKIFSSGGLSLFKFIQIRVIFSNTLIIGANDSVYIPPNKSRFYTNNFSYNTHYKYYEKSYILSKYLRSIMLLMIDFVTIYTLATICLCYNPNSIF